MPSKSVREMTKLEKAHHSLAARMFHAIMAMSLIIGAAAVSFGFYLYVMALEREYKAETWNLSRSASFMVDEQRFFEKYSSILKQYQEIPESEKEEGSKAAFLVQLADQQDETFAEIQDTLLTLQEHNEGEAAYVAAIDKKNRRRIFLVDSDPTNTFCPPGSFDVIEEDKIDDLLNGSRINWMGKLMGDSAVPAVFANLNNYGYRCTAATKLFETDGYVVMVFMGKSMNHIVDISKTFLLIYLAYVAVVTMVVALVMIQRMKRTVVKPINELADAAAAYSQDKRDGHRTSRHFDKLDISTGDEIENLSWTMKDMETDLADYIKNLTTITAEKERMHTELNVASQIQEGMIPQIFPVFPERHEFSVYGSMQTAKEVGGDFYDIFMVDEDHLGLVMADVSGKGIPAALFMMGSKIMLNNFATMDELKPSVILEHVNNGLCANNSAEMFVTVWLGILEISTGKLTAASAGHEYPAIMRADGGFEVFRDPHGFVLGGLEGAKYKDYEVQLEPGDAIFEYTDGVTEATNKDNELFGEHRMLAALNTKSDAGPDEILGNVHAAISDFVGEAEQFDDITMLCLRYKGPKAD